MTTKKIFFFASLITLILLGLLFTLLTPKSEISNFKFQISNSLTPIPSLNPYLENQTKPIYSSPDNSFAIIANQDNSYYLISILESPFATIRQQAEKDFLEQLQLTPEQACRLSVEVSTPYFANPTESGQVYPLSFCP